MAAAENKKYREGYAMNGGDSSYSYSQHSSFQKRAIDKTNALIREAIATNFDIKDIQSSSTLKIADLGCSVGPNTFLVVQNIIDSIEHKYKTQGINSQFLEFQVFFNDLTSNDFNFLFTSLPPHRAYYASGVPGSFFNRLFLRSSLHFVYSSNSLTWLSDVPKEIVDKNSPAWNKGHVIYTNSAQEVVEAYAVKHAKDFNQFLHCRAEEIVCGGLMTIVLPGRSDETPHSQSIFNRMWDLIGDSLMDMARNGIISEEKVDNFNMPMYMTSPRELKEVIESNGCFSIERMECLPQDKVENTPSRATTVASHLRAAMEGLIKAHFGNEILDNLFDLLKMKLEESSLFETGKAVDIFLVLKRN